MRQEEGMRARRRPLPGLQSVLPRIHQDPGMPEAAEGLSQRHVVRRVPQAKVSFALSHVNSEPRAMLNGNSPGSICTIWLDKKVLAINEYRFIEPDSVFLSPDLLK